MVCACIPVGLVVCRCKCFNVNAHIFCVDSANDAVPWYFRSCDIHCPCREFPWAVYEVASCCYSDAVGI